MKRHVSKRSRWGRAWSRGPGRALVYTCAGAWYACKRVVDEVAALSATAYWRVRAVARGKARPRRNPYCSSKPQRVRSLPPAEPRDRGDGAASLTPAP